MKSFIVCCLVLSVVGLTSAAPQFVGVVQPSDVLQFLEELESAQVMSDDASVESMDEEADTQQILDTLEILNPILKEVIVPIVVDLGKAGIKVGTRLVNYIVNCSICKRCSNSVEQAEVLNQYFAYENERSANLMSVVYALESTLATEQVLSEVQVKQMKQSLTAEVQFLEKISNAVKKVISKARRAAKSIGRVAKRVIC